MRALVLGPVTVERRGIPRCPSCKHHGRVEHNCFLCGGTGFFMECDVCQRESIKQWDHCFVVDSGKADWRVCERAECLQHAVTVALPAIPSEEERAA